MPDPALTILRDLIDRHGKAVCADPARVAPLLAEALAALPRSRRCLQAAVDVGVTAEMLEWSDPDTALMLLDQWSARLTSQHGLTPAAGEIRRTAAGPGSS